MDWKQDWSEWFKQSGIELPKGVYPKVIFEGVDASGKSTVIDILLDIMNHTFLLHTSAPVKGSTPEYYERVLQRSIDLIGVLNQPFIADRFHIGEAVYGGIFRGYEFDCEDIEKQLLPLNVKQVYVKADENVILDRLQKRGDWYIKLEDVKPIMERYEKKLLNSKLPTYVLDTTNDIQPDDIRGLIEFIYS